MALDVADITGPSDVPDGIDDIVVAERDRLYFYEGHTAWTSGGTISTDAYLARYFNTSTDRPTWVPTDSPSVIQLGDLNNDGKQDVLLGIYGSSCSASNAGSVYVVFQPATWLSDANLYQSSTSGECDGSEMNLDGINADPTCATSPERCGFVISGANTGDYAYIPVITDVNGDSKKEIVLAAPGYSSSAGGVFVLYGRKTVPWDSVVALEDVEY